MKGEGSRQFVSIGQGDEVPLILRRQLIHTSMTRRGGGCTDNACVIHTVRMLIGGTNLEGIVSKFVEVGPCFFLNLADFVSFLAVLASLTRLICVQVQKDDKIRFWQSNITLFTPVHA